MIRNGVVINVFVFFGKLFNKGGGVVDFVFCFG